MHSTVTIVCRNTYGGCVISWQDPGLQMTRNRNPNPGPNTAPPPRSGRLGCSTICGENLCYSSAGGFRPLNGGEGYWKLGPTGEAESCKGKWKFIWAHYARGLILPIPPDPASALPHDHIALLSGCDFSSASSVYSRSMSVSRPLPPHT